MTGSDNDRPTSGRGDVVAVVRELVEDIFDSLQTIAAATRSLWSRLEKAGSVPCSTELAGLRDVVVGELRRQAGMFNGAGLVVAEGVLADHRRWLEWWRPGDRPADRAVRLNLDFNPDSEYFYDYSTMEWFAVPRDRGVRWVHGPYLDYTGVDLYVCTFAVPVTSEHGIFLGIAGADVPVTGLDAKLLPALNAGSVPLALTNAEGRVIVANHADHVVGSKIRTDTADPPRVVPATPWSLVALRDSQS